jgi:hypothetical protein
LDKTLHIGKIELIMNNCSFHNNLEKARREAAGDIIAVGNTLIANSNFRSNRGIKYSGAISTGGNSVVITNTNVTDTSLTAWGSSAGVEIQGGNILIDHSSVSGNHYAEDGRAECGGIMVYENSSVEIVDSTITQNEGIRGGIYVWSNSNLTIRNCSISDNYVFNEGNLMVIGGAIEGNQASIGGSIWNANHMNLKGVTLDEIVEPQPWECV